jgi:hypothetical protein
MCCFLNRALPFCLALFVGIALTSAVSHKTSTTRGWKSCHRSWASYHLVSETPLKIESVPDWDFSDAAKKSTGASASLRLIALFDSDGIVKEIRPYPMLPFGVAESEAGHGQYADYTPMMMETQFVKQLPYGFTESAIEQVRLIRFKPRLVDGQPVSEWVMVNTEFGYTESRFSIGCSAITVTVMNDNGTLWHGNTWIQRVRGCILV